MLFEQAQLLAQVGAVLGRRWRRRSGWGRGARGWRRSWESEIAL
jgi:hypothetical protein